MRDAGTGRGLCIPSLTSHISHWDILLTVLPDLTSVVLHVLHDFAEEYKGM